MLLIWNLIVGSRIGRLVAGVLAVMLTAFGLILYGRKIQREQDRVDDLENYKETRERIDETTINTDVDDAVDRLRSNGQFR